MSKKVIIVHENPEVHQYIEAIKPDWDTQIPVTSPQGIWEGLGSGQLANTSEIILISDSYYLSNPEGFFQALVSYSPFALYMVFQENPNETDNINANALKAFEATGTIPAPYYFVDITNPDLEGVLTSITAQYELDKEDYLRRKASFEAQKQQAEVAATPEPAEPIVVEQAISPEPAPAPVPVPEPAAQPAPVAEQTVVMPAPVATTPPTQTATPEPGFSFNATKEEPTPSEGIYTNALKRDGLVVASTSSKGGSGKTTTAFGMAITLSLASEEAVRQGAGGEPLKVIIIDADMKDGQIGLSINQTTPSILKLYTDVSGGEIPDDVLRNNIIPVPVYGLDILLAPKRGVHADYIIPEWFRGLVRQLRKMYDFIVLDTSVNYLDAFLNHVVYPEADAIIFVSTLDKKSILAMPRWIAEVVDPDREAGIVVDKNKIGIVINQAIANVGIDMNVIKAALKEIPVLAAIPADLKAVLTASNNGSLNKLVTKHPALAPEYFNLVKKIWQDRSPLASIHDAYLNSEEYRQDKILASKGQEEKGPASHIGTPLSEVAADNKKRKR